MWPSSGRGLATKEGISSMSSSGCPLCKRRVKPPMSHFPAASHCAFTCIAKSNTHGLPCTQSTHNRFTFPRFANVILTPTHTCIPACNEQHDYSATLHTCNLHSCIFLRIMLKPARQHELKSSPYSSYDDAITRCFCLFNQLIVYRSTSSLDQASRANSDQHA